MDSTKAVAARRTPRPWLFGLASVPYGGFNGVVAVALPYVLRRHGIPVERIAAIGALVQTPTIWYFLWAPVVDVRFRRRTWVMTLAVASAVCSTLALARVGGAIRSLTVLLVAASIFNQPISSALGGLVSTVMPNTMNGRTAGWSQAASSAVALPRADSPFGWPPTHRPRSLRSRLGCSSPPRPSPCSPSLSRRGRTAHWARISRECFTTF